MKILLVEDEQSKRDQVIDVLKEHFSELDVVEARSLNSGLRLVLSARFDLVILDMTMPTFDITAEEEGGRPQAFGGRELLRNMKRRNVSTPVVLLTQFDRFGTEPDARSIDEIDAELRAEHAGPYRGAIKYNASVDSWRQELVDALRSVVNGGLQ